MDLPTNGTIFAIDLSNGDIKWETDFPDRFQSASLAVSGDVLYAIDRSGVFYGLDAATGKILKEIPFIALTDPFFTLYLSLRLSTIMV